MFEVRYVPPAESRAIDYSTWMRWLPTLALLAACGGGGGAGDDTSGDHQPPGDAKHQDASIDVTELPGDFACNNVAWPATAPDPLSVQARVNTTASR